MSKGVHLHVHSHESSLDGLSTPRELAERAKELGMVAIGLTDHGVMGGTPELAKACQDLGIKPIPGSEVYMTADHTYNSKEMAEMRDEVVKRFQLYPIEKGSFNIKKPKLKEVNSFSSLCRKKNFNKADKELRVAAEELLSPSIMQIAMTESEVRNLESEIDALIQMYTDQMKYRNFHLLVLAKNNEGLKNLFRITSDAHLYGFYKSPRTDLAYIRKNNLGKGLIATTACLGGYFAQCVLSGQEEEAVRFVKECEETFEHFYLEKQATHIKEQIYLNEKIDEFLEKGLLTTEKVLTTDVHYARKEDIKTHDLLVASATKSCILDENRLKYDEEFWLKSDEEMMYGCNDPVAWENTKKIADMVDVSFQTEPLLPVYDEDVDAKEILKQMSTAGLISRYKQENFNLEEYIPRLEYELSVINSMGFADYFLVVQDYINASLDAGFPVGPGRGSAAGSLVCYTLGITQIDPIKYGLIFERFLNPERIGLPDIDADFSYEGTQYVFKYLQKRYGEEKVAQIGTRSILGGKSVCKHVGRTLGYDVKTQNAFAKEIKEDNLDKALKENPDLQKYIDKYPEWWGYMKDLEGVISSKGVHAGGVVLSPDPIHDHMPLRICKSGLPTTEYDKDEVEEYLVKFDILKLQTLDIVHLAVELAGIQDTVDINKLDVEDREVYRNIYQKQILSGIFQVESDGMKSTMAEVIPSNFHDLSAIIALYRPGPLQFIPVYARRKHKREAVTYPDDRLKEILKDTYGVWVVA